MLRKRLKMLLVVVIGILCVIAITPMTNQYQINIGKNSLARCQQLAEKYSEGGDFVQKCVSVESEARNPQADRIVGYLISGFTMLFVFLFFYYALMIHWEEKSSVEVVNGFFP